MAHTYGYNRLIAAYLVLRAAVYFVVLYVTQPSRPLDVLESLAWGREWRLVHENHPGATAWIVGALDRVGGGDSFLLSLPAPVAVSLTMAAVWLLARSVVGERRGVVAVLALEGVYYFTVVAAEFNHNILLMAAWAWVVLLTHRAFFAPANKHNIGRWIALGVVCAFSLYVKYSALLLLAVLFVWSVGDSQARQCYHRRGLWIALAVFAVLVLPQVNTLWQLGFSPFHFAVGRAKEADTFMHHLLYPLRFILAQCAALLFAVVLCRVALSKNSSFHRSSGETRRFDAPLQRCVSPNDTRRGKLDTPVDGCVSADASHLWTGETRKGEWTGETRQGKRTGETRNVCRFVLIAAFAPLLLAVCISAVGGWKFQSHWGAAMLSFMPLAVMTLARRYELNLPRFVKSAAVVAALSLIVLVCVNLFAPHFTGRGKRIHYPGAQIGKAVEEAWTARHPGKPLIAVVGAKHIAALVSFYAPSQPRMIDDNANWNLSYGVSREVFEQSGGVIVWMINDGKRKNMPAPAYAEQWQNKGASRTENITLPWATSADIPPLEIGVIIVNP